MLCLALHFLRHLFAEPDLLLNGIPVRDHTLTDIPVADLVRILLLIVGKNSGFTTTDKSPKRATLAENWREKTVMLADLLNVV